jgi:hypothetical protein
MFYIDSIVIDERWYASQTFYNLKRNSSRLLITSGDSWTWGDSLGQTSLENNCDDYEYRIAHIYGSLMAQQLNCDFINIARPGASNIAIHDMLANVLAKLDKEYDHIDVCITLTELGRELIGDPIWINDTLDYTSLNNFLSSYEATMLSKFQILFDQYPKINFLIARNFTSTFNENLNIVKHAEKTWVEVLSENQDINMYPNSIRLMTGLAMGPLEKFLINKQLKKLFKRELVELLYQGSEGIDWLEESKFNYKIYSKHPNEEGHRLWADYLLTCLDK